MHIGTTIFLLAWIFVPSASASTDTNFLFSPKGAEGYWQLDPNEIENVRDLRCEDKPLQIIIDMPNSRYVSVMEDNRAEAEILEIEKDRFWIRYDGEKRQDSNGRPVEWAWVSAGPNHFYWVRRDWLQSHPGGRTPLRQRCAQPENVS